ncbi:alpha/beta hydrolase fold/Alpha/beta hydrolase family/Serine aminopeptidase, S33/Serine hydrolase (FSH1), putative [Leishmania lindenbergi]|uniref:Alpha/beta hydrolase fold/Alpha/beta hydrolase family/Serine aminopeptidase, S33 n=1 Tax=Leishmania lindenbergi TaxID=651832 RepID=A0AAW3AMJ6_9TRYP
MTATLTAELDAAAGLPKELHGKAQPLPLDKFARVGKCASTGKEITLCYRTLGNPDNPCLLLVMGLGGTLLNWKNEFVQRLLQAGFFVVQYDNRDTGLSTHLDGYTIPAIARMILPAWASIGEGIPPYTLYDMGRDAWGLLTALGIQSVHVLGTSMGGMIAQCMALQHPERVKSLTIFYTHSSGPHVKPQTWKMSFAMMEKPSGPSFEEQVNFMVHMNSLFSGDYPQDEQETRSIAAANLTRCPVDNDGVMRQIWAVRRAESRENDLRRLKGVPTLIVHGMKDTMIPFENGVHLAHLIRESRLVAFAHMGHSIPRELYRDIVEEIKLQKALGEEAKAQTKRSSSGTGATDSITPTEDTVEG